MPSIALTRGVAGTAWSAVYSRPLQISPRVYQTCGWCACVCVLRYTVHRFLSRPSCISCRPSPFAILGKCCARPPFGPGSQDQGRLHIRFALSLKDLEQMQQKDWRLGLPGAGHQLVTTSNYIRKTGFRDVRRKRCNSCTACYTCERARGEGGCAADRRGRGGG